MTIDKSSFFILVGTMAASGAGGWFARDKLVLKSEIPTAAPPPPPPVVSAEPAPPPPPKSAEPEPPAAPPCDDTHGETPVCPAFPDPGDEGGCGQMARQRCEQYRESLKPKVATAAIECLKKLKPGALCDPIALNKCGHEALMAACPAPEAETLATCTKISDACKASTPGPTAPDCRQTLSGMNDVGRRKMVACVQKLCDTRGLYGCEAR